MPRQSGLADSAKEATDRPKNYRDECAADMLQAQTADVSPLKRLETQLRDQQYLIDKLKAEIQERERELLNLYRIIHKY